MPCHDMLGGNPAATLLARGFELIPAGAGQKAIGFIKKVGAKTWIPITGVTSLFLLSEPGDAEAASDALQDVIGEDYSFDMVNPAYLRLWAKTDDFIKYYMAAAILLGNPVTNSNLMAFATTIRKEAPFGLDDVIEMLRAMVKANSRGLIPLSVYDPINGGELEGKLDKMLDTVGRGAGRVGSGIVEGSGLGWGSLAVMVLGAVAVYGYTTGYWQRR